MKAQSLLKYALLGFVAVALIIIVARETDEDAQASAGTAEQPLPADGLVAIYFHGNIRCPTCETIEAYAKESVDTRFADDLTAGNLTWRVLNYESPENAHFVKEYEIAAPTVVLIQRKAGRDAQWQNLARVWELVGDKPAFVDYIAAETKSLLPTK